MLHRSLVQSTFDFNRTPSFSASPSAYLRSSSRGQNLGEKFTERDSEAGARPSFKWPRRSWLTRPRHYSMAAVKRELTTRGPSILPDLVMLVRDADKRARVAFSRVTPAEGEAAAIRTSRCHRLRLRLYRSFQR